MPDRTASTSSLAIFDGAPVGGVSLAGAVFAVASSAGAGATVQVEDGWSASFTASPNIVVSGPAPDGYGSALAAGLRAAQQALDVLSTRGRADLVTVDTANEHIVAWQDAGRSAVRFVCTNFFNADVGVPTIVVRDAAGDVKPTPAPIESWHQSMRYYRQAQLSDDLFDSLRSLWLAVENLLDSLTPWTPGKREGAWLKDALTAAEAHIDFARYLPADSPKTAVNHAYEYFYDQLRVTIFHAKGSRGPRLPHEVDGMADLAQRHERLTRLYLDLLGEMTGVRRPSGVMTHGGFEAFTGGWEDNPQIAVTDDPAPFNRKDTSPNPTGGKVITVPAARVRTLDRPGLKTLLARLDSHALRDLAAIRRVVLVLGGSLAACAVLDGELQLGNADHFEARFGLRLNNKGTPRSFVGI